MNTLLNERKKEASNIKIQSKPPKHYLNTIVLVLWYNKISALLTLHLRFFTDTAVTFGLKCSDGKCVML